MHDNLCAEGRKSGYPKSVRGAILSEALSGPVHFTVNNGIPSEVLMSRDGVNPIVRMHAKFNPVTYAQEVSYAYVRLSGVSRGEKESYTSYVNRFEVASTELESLVGPATGLVEQHLVFQLLKGA